jgi:hypothetical protein
MRPIEAILRREEGRGKERVMDGVNLKYIVSTFINVTMYS